MMSALDKMLQEIEEDVDNNESIRALRWWKKIMNPDFEHFDIVQSFVLDVCKRNPRIILELKEAVLAEMDAMSNGEPEPEISIDE